MEGVTRSSVLTLEVGAGELRGRPGGAEHILQGEVREFHWKLASCRHEALATVPLDGQRASNNIGVRRERERGGGGRAYSVLERVLDLLDRLANTRTTSRGMPWSSAVRACAVSCASVTIPVVLSSCSVFVPEA